MGVGTALPWAAEGSGNLPSPLPMCWACLPTLGPRKQTQQGRKQRGGSASRSCETVCFSLLACGLHAACFQRCINWNLLKKSSL